MNNVTVKYCKLTVPSILVLITDFHGNHKSVAYAVEYFLNLEVLRVNEDHLPT